MSSTVLLAAAAPAPAESTGPQEEVAQAIEAATGTGDIALSVAAGGKASVAVTETGQGATRVVVPSASSEAVEITAPGGKTLRLGLPDEQSVTGVKSPSGTVVYTGAGRSTDVAVQPTADGGARALVVLKDGSAPQEHRFELGLPEGFGLRAAEDGGYDIGFVSEGVEAMVGHIDPAWAKDANGRAVDTSYRVDGGTLVQSVEYEDSTAFPVVADPKVTWGWGIYVKYNRAETKRMAKGMSKSKYAAALCGFLPGVVGGGCALVVYDSLGSITNTFKNAGKSGKCVKMKYSLPPPVPLQWNTTKC
ncbi:hypothetical protein AB0E21_20895 [Streptomyces sp. NPDC047967]|uniref:hypothetical protein n=1 Tax=unclassified Streptomyces TaxID=2593676 RepID=UPI001C0D8A4F|nr:hypothetical protein [Streptomyces sp. YPW6]QWQ43444.1 hypothetical protein KME66_22555 [Streptomyces sp. YPW6]